MEDQGLGQLQEAHVDAVEEVGEGRDVGVDAAPDHEVLLGTRVRHLPRPAHVHHIAGERKINTDTYKYSSGYNLNTKSGILKCFCLSYQFPESKKIIQIFFFFKVQTTTRVIKLYPRK